MQYELSVPARMNILGNPTDGLEGDFAVISAAIDLRAGALIEPSQDVNVEMRTASPIKAPGDSKIITSEVYPTGLNPLPLTSSLDLVKGAINRIYKFSPELQSKYNKRGFRLSLWSEVPRQSGLGGSSLLILLTLASMRAFYKLDNHFHNDYVLSELTQRIEAHDLNITCGYIDRYVPLFGGIAYVDFREKLFQREMEEEPFATYERLDAWVQNLPLVVMTTGLQHHSGDVHSRLRPEYLKAQVAWDEDRRKTKPDIIRLMEETYRTAWHGKIALLKNDLHSFGTLMNTNHFLVNEMMFNCGFQDGAGWANNIMIDAALTHGALGAKLTGAGGGGSVYALTEPGKEDIIEDAWRKEAHKHGLNNASIYRPSISLDGLRVNEVYPDSLQLS